MSEKPIYENLATGKPHISFSELRDWQECSYRHKLKHVDHIDLGKPGPLLDVGTAIHASCENYLKTRVMDASIAHKHLEVAWKTNIGVDGFDEKARLTYVAEIDAILKDVPSWLDKTFPGWELIDAEHMLYESITKTPHAFKGFIDCIIKVKDKKGNDLIWILDWKSTSWGWSIYKKSDPHVSAQLVLYKNFWAAKTGTNMKDIRCGFVLLKRSAKPGNHCELVKISVGDVTSDRSLKVVNNMLMSVKRGIAIKNRDSCKYCDYKDTQYCT